MVNEEGIFLNFACKEDIITRSQLVLIAPAQYEIISADESQSDECSQLEKVDFKETNYCLKLNVIPDASMVFNESHYRPYLLPTGTKNVEFCFILPI